MVISSSVLLFVLTPEAIKLQNQSVVLENIHEAKEAIATALEKLGHGNQSDTDLLTDLLHSAVAFEAEIYYQRQEWDLLLNTIQVRSFFDRFLSVSCRTWYRTSERGLLQYRLTNALRILWCVEVQVPFERRYAFTPNFQYSGQTANVPYTVRNRSIP